MHVGSHTSFLLFHSSAFRFVLSSEVVCRQLKNSLKMSLSQQQAGKRMDKLITASLTQVGVSLAWGLVASLVFFKRKSWPVVVGAGFGVGAAYADISNEVNLNS
ncbi:MICOS complex subunit Mic10-like [Thrips palmi]|uniref:MICOS complex subunit MIC10 n=1 Tax=Thrips palmi TaxID=161013 RepID=A0A6P8Y2I4_THRPL|nr:MICOS complex subunit Mic10-like [Thrips palmi]